MAGTLDPDLYFVEDVLCPSCPIFIFDKVKKVWKRAPTKPVVGDHVVLDFTTEKVVRIAQDTQIVYRTLNRRYDIPLWNGSIPDKLPIVDHRVTETNTLTYEEDQVLVPVTQRKRSVHLKLG